MLYKTQCNTLSEHTWFIWCLYKMLGRKGFSVRIFRMWREPWVQVCTQHMHQDLMSTEVFKCRVKINALHHYKYYGSPLNCNTLVMQQWNAANVCKNTQQSLSEGPCPICGFSDLLLRSSGKSSCSHCGLVLQDKSSDTNEHTRASSLFMIMDYVKSKYL